MWKLPTYQDLTDDQKKVIDLDFKKSHIVTGPPGSGKTVMAIYRTQAMVKANANIIFIVYNRLLKLYTQGALKSLMVPVDSISTMHSWFPKWFEQTYGVGIPKLSPFEYDWVKCLDVVGKKGVLEKNRYHIIVDEGQDLPKEFYLFISNIAKTVTVFADENQAIKENQSTIKEIKSYASIDSEGFLETNFRNTKAIASVSNHFWTGVGAAPVKTLETVENGDRPTLDSDKDFSSLVEWIKLFENTHSTQQIGLLVPYTSIAKKLYNRLNSKTKNPVEIYSSDPKLSNLRQVDFSTPGLKIIMWASAKGLEFDSVILPELNQYNKMEEEADRFRRTMFVLASRAKRELIFRYSGEMEPKIISHLPMDLIDDFR